MANSMTNIAKTLYTLNALERGRAAEPPFDSTSISSFKEIEPHISDGLRITLQANEQNPISIENKASPHSAFTSEKKSNPVNLPPLSQKSTRSARDEEIMKKILEVRNRLKPSHRIIRA